MALTKAQTALLCGVVALLPLAWQAHTHSRLTREQSELDAQLLASSQVADQLEKDLRRTRDLLLRAQAGREKAELRMASLRAQSENAATRPAYHWDEASRLARVPKALLDRAKVRAAVNRRGQLSDEIKELLQLSELEARQTQAILDQFLESYYAVQARNLRAVPATAEDLKGHKPDETRVFEIAGMGESFDQLRDGLFQELGAVLGPDRLSLFREALQGWMSIHDEMKMVSGEMAVLEFGRRERFYRPKPGASGIEWGFIKLDHSGAMEVSVPLEDLPAMYQPYLQDWIRLAQSQSAARTDTQGIRAP